MNSLLDNFHAFTPQPIGVSEYGAAFRVVLIPLRAGQPLPVVSYDAATQTAEVRRPDQLDTLQFTGGEQSPATFTVRRDGANLLAPFHGGSPNREARPDTKRRLTRP
jgi:hypothetical protein